MTWDNKATAAQREWEHSTRAWWAAYLREHPPARVDRSRVEWCRCGQMIRLCDCATHTDWRHESTGHHRCGPSGQGDNAQPATHQGTLF